MTVLQMVGTLLAIPVGVGSGYSMYRANFSVETTCQSLRANIVTMLDKSVDAGTRHMLVRRDVEAFEHSCGGVDPDATAAFKALLAADKAPAPVATATVRHAEARPEPVARKAEPRVDLAAKQPAATTTAVIPEPEPLPRAAAASDAVWLAAVRRALVSQTLVTPVADPVPPVDAAKAIAATQTPPADTAKPTAATQTPPAVQPLAREAHTVNDGAAQPMTLAAPAPALPPATSVATARGPQSDADHPVPPAPIPEITPVPKPANATRVAGEGRTRSRLGALVAQIPLVGPALEAIDVGSH